MPHSVAFGLPDVVAPPKPPPPPGTANPPCWSRERRKVYDPFSVIPCIVSPPSDTVTCVDAERSDDVSWLTEPYSGCRRDALLLDAPVPGTMVTDGTYTGRPPSEASVNFGVASRLMSRDPVCSIP